MRHVLLATLIPLAGCVTAEQQAANQAWDAEQRRQDQALYMFNLKTQCEAIGFKENTDPWRDCVLRMHQQAQSQNAALRNMVIQQYLIDQQQQQQRPPPPVLPQPRQPTTTNCTRDYFGNFSCTTQ